MVSVLTQHVGFQDMYDKSWKGGLQEKSPAKGIKRADLDMLLDLLDAKPIKWRELRNQLAVAFQSAEQHS